MRPGQGGVLCRSAGTNGVLMAREANWAQISLPSGEIRRVPATCRAVIGKVGNSEHSSIRLGKAGRSRWLGRRPTVRGTAMNPIDHLHVGGEVVPRAVVILLVRRAFQPRVAVLVRRRRHPTLPSFVAASRSVMVS